MEQLATLSAVADNHNEPYIADEFQAGYKARLDHAAQAHSATASWRAGWAEANADLLIEPWANNHQLREQLSFAGERYAALIGIVHPEDSGIPKKTIMQDRARYPDLICEDCQGLRVWDCLEAVTFVAALTGASREVSALWLDHAWPGSGEHKDEAHHQTEDFFAAKAEA